MASPIIVLKKISFLFMFYMVSIGMILKGQNCYHNFVYSSSTVQ